MIHDFIDGFMAYFRILPLIRTLKLWSFMLITGALSLLIGVGIIYLTITYADVIGDWLISFYRWNFGLEVLSVIADWMVGLAIIVLAVILYKYIILIIVAPFMSLLSEKIESRLRGSQVTLKFSLSRAIKELIRGLRIALRNIIREIFYTLILLIAGLFPFFAIISGPGILIVQCYYAGFGNMDFFLERHANIRQSVTFVKKHKALAIANGAVYLFILFIPVIGLIVAPTFGAAAATVESMKRLDQEEFLN